MRKLWLTSFIGCLFALSASAKNPFEGRWDITIMPPSRSYPSWMEVVEQNGRSQVLGNAPEITWELTAAGDKLTGIQKAGTAANVVGTRAPALKRAMPKSWSKPEALSNGKDLTRWEPFPAGAASNWIVKDGELVNAQKGANLKFFCPEGQNIGIYLRGRYEIQVGTEGGRQPKREMGAIFGHYAAAKELPLNLGTWQTYDITLVGRYVTVVMKGNPDRSISRETILGACGSAILRFPFRTNNDA
jgi:hypothetical protein